ncbi:Ubiquitin carboxyl-terminal hydrolase 24 [Hondaea fermentalgiana]|uniref:Ubiquitin carboxyl-terminal hydrolase 24 n=1 Tax=Hondaea fermentalgiana TaxID=2315210 RepID=A0A2R5GIL9_9STRA|nr:Ubiquitin carboxyl-terminal hydrolase 24 [Hondaea fermentalgiana]|eukprot:GBG30736.1 Ubiquitin carboxyl-terminal hydrolase 24 [Hondaea fermentalgiana]
MGATPRDMDPPGVNPGAAGAGGNANAGMQQTTPSGMDRQQLQQLTYVSNLYVENQSVEYAPCGKAMTVALQFAGSPEVEAFMRECIEGVVGIFLEQTAHSVLVKLLHNFQVVLQGTCELVLHDLKKYQHVQYLQLLARILSPDAVFYSTPDAMDAELTSREVIKRSRGFKVREIVVKTFYERGGFDLLEQMMTGKVPVRRTQGGSGDPGVSETAGGASTGENLNSSSSSTGQARSLTANEVVLLLEPFVQAQDLIGRERAEAACRAAIQAVERMDEEALKTQRTVELAKLRKALKVVLGDDERLRYFLRTLALRTFTSSAFQLRKLGLDLIGELVTDAQQAGARSMGSTDGLGSSMSTTAPPPPPPPPPAGAGAADDDMFDTKSMHEWLVDNEVLEKLFGSTDALHPALVGRSQRLLEFMARGAAMQEKHVDLMFKCCVGHHDSVRGAVQSLLAELAVDHDVHPPTAAYILRCASRLVDDHRGDMLFFVEKLMSCGTASAGYKSNLSLCEVSVLQALLDLLWRLLETTTDLSSPRRKQLVDFVVEVLRMPNACMLRARHIVTYIEILQASAQDAQATKPETASQAVRISTAYELLQKIILMFDVIQVSSSPLSSTGRSFVNSTFESASQSYSAAFPGSNAAFESSPDNGAGLAADADAINSSSSRDAPGTGDEETHASLIVQEDGDGAKQLRTQSGLILELQERYKLLELVVEEIKAHCHRTSMSVKVTREQLLTHMQTLQIRLDFLQYCVSRSRLMLKFELVHQLWEALAQPLEREICMVWLRQVAVVDNGLCPGLSAEVTSQVFSQLLCGDMEFKQLSEPGFKCFSAFFLDVNRAEDILDGEALNHVGVANATSESISSTILDTHVKAADAESSAAADSTAPVSASSSTPSQEEKNNTSSPSSQLVETENGGSSTTTISSGKGEKVKKMQKHRSSIFTEFNQTPRNRSSGTEPSSATGGNPAATSLTSPNNALSPSALTPSHMFGFTFSGGPTRSDQSSASDIRISVVKRADVVGIDTLWRIVESAPEATSARAMDLLLQVQCRIEALGSETASTGASDVDISEDPIVDIAGDLEPDAGAPGPHLTDQKTGLERRRAFLDRTFALLEQSVTSKGSGTARVQRCIRLITNYLNAFPQTARLIPHAPPRGAELHFQVHHDKVLLFSKRDIGKALQISVPGTITSQVRRAQAARYMHGMILDYDKVSKEHSIWLVDGSRIRRDMGSMDPLDHGIKSASSNNIYQMLARATLDPRSLPVQPSPGVIAEDDVEQAARSYRALILHAREKHTLGALQQMILEDLVAKDELHCPLNQRTISLSVPIFHKSQRGLGHNQQPGQFVSRSADYGHERVLIGMQNTLDSILPEADQAAGVNRTATSRILRYVVYVDVDETAEMEAPISEVERDADLPSMLITTEGSKYVSMLMRLLDDPSISNTTRVELWELLQTLPTDQGMLRRLSEASKTAVDWGEELRPHGPFMLRALYVLMIVNRLIGNQQSRSRFEMSDGAAIADELDEGDDDDDDDDDVSMEEDFVAPKSSSRGVVENGSLTEASTWRSYFFKTEGFQEVVWLLGRILSESSDTGRVEQGWYWVWQQSVALPVVMRIIRFCVRGSLAGATTGTAQDPHTGKNAAPLRVQAGGRVKDVQMEDFKPARGMAFSPASKESISRHSDLKLLARNLSVLIVLAHRATCSQSGIHAEAERMASASQEMSASGGGDAEEIPIPSLPEDGPDEDETEDDESDEPAETGSGFGYGEDDLGMTLDRDASAGGRGNGKDQASESDNAMLEVLVDAVQTSFMVLQSNEALGAEFLASQVHHQQAHHLAWLGASSVVDVLALSRFSVVRDMLRDLLSMLCSFSEENRLAVESLAHETLYTIPRNCPTCDDYFAFVRREIIQGQFRVDRFTRLVIARLVQYPALSRQQIRREAKLLNSFGAALRAQTFKPRPGRPRRSVANEDSPQYIAIKAVTLTLLDDTLIGYLDLMELILQEDKTVCEDASMCTPLMESLFHRFLMAVPSASKKRASAIASLPDVRTRVFGLLRLMAEASDRCLKWLVDASSQFVRDTPVPVTRQGRLDWSFKPVDFRKSPSGFVGLVNQGATCYQNSVLQQLFMAPALRDWILHAPGVLGSIVASRTDAINRALDDGVQDEISPHEEDEGAEYLWNDIPRMRDSKKNRLLRALQYTFTFLKHSDKRFFNPRGFVNESAGLKLTDGHLSQNDAIEFYSRLVDYLEETTQGKSQCKALQDMLYVRTCTMNVRNCDGKHRTESEVGTPFLTLNVRSGMAGPTLHSLDDALESWFKAEKLSGLECEVCNTKDKERRFEADQIKCFSKLPPVLVVQLQRFDFDYEIMQPTKLNHRVSFEHRIDLYRFTRAAVMEKFDEEASRANPATPSVEAAEVVSGSTKVEGSAGRASPALAQSSEPVKLAESDGKEEPPEGTDADEDAAIKPKPNTVYELSGVVVHQGSGANFGHYYSFIKDRRSGSWFRFDDERVTPFDVRNLEEECFGGPLGSGGGSQGGWSSSSNSGGMNMGGMNLGLGGMGKFKQYGARDNNAYLLLYELLDGPRSGVATAYQPKLSMPRAPSMSSAPVLESPATNSLGFARAGQLVCRLQVWLRQARLALTAKHRLKKIEQDVWEDNQRTLRHGLVMVPTFMDFCLGLLQIQSTDEDTLEATAKMGLIVYTRATLRIHSLKSRLRVWDTKLRDLLRRSLDMAPGVIPWFLGAVCKPDIRHDTLEPLLQHCTEKAARSFAVSLLNDVIGLAVDAAWGPSIAEGPCAPQQAVEGALVQFVDVMCGLLPMEPTNCRFMRPYFAVWQGLCRAPPLRDMLLERDVDVLLLRVYQLADPSLRAAGRNRGSSLDLHSAQQQQAGALSGVVEGDFSALVDALTLLLMGSTSDESYRRLARLSGYYEDPMSADGDGDAEDIEDEFGEESGIVGAGEEGTEEHARSSTMSWFMRQARMSRAVRLARGMPSKGDAPSTTAHLPEAVIIAMARRDPRPGALLLARACKGDIKLSVAVIRELLSSMDTSISMLEISNTTVESICARIKAVALALSAVGSIEDGHLYERSREIVHSCLTQMIQLQKEVKSLASRQEANRTGARYPQSIYYDSETEDMYHVNVYAVYRLAKTLGQLYVVNAGVREVMNEFQQHWVDWVPKWLDSHSYKRALGGNMDVWTRSVAKGRTVRLLMRAAAMAHPKFRYKMLPPEKVTIIVKGAGTPECNGEYIFDGYFRPNESNQIDSVTPKFVKFVRGRPYNLYRCQVKDKQYTWYISELSAKPGTNSDTDYYSSHQGNPSSMPPEGGWTPCGQGAKPAPSHVRILREAFDPEDDPCKALETRKQIAAQRQAAAANTRAARAGSSSASTTAPSSAGPAAAAAASSRAGSGGNSSSSAFTSTPSASRATPTVTPVAFSSAANANNSFHVQTSGGDRHLRPSAAFGGEDNDDEGEDGDDEEEEDDEDDERETGAGEDSFGHEVGESASNDLAALRPFGAGRSDDDDDLDDAASDQAVIPGGSVDGDFDDDRDNLSTASGSGSDQQQQQRQQQQQQHQQQQPSHGEPHHM